MAPAGMLRTRSPERALFQRGRNQSALPARTSRVTASSSDAIRSRGRYRRQAAAIVPAKDRPWWRLRVMIEILPPVALPEGTASGESETRRATDFLIHTIAARNGQEYVDAYARTWAETAA